MLSYHPPLGDILPPPGDTVPASSSTPPPAVFTSRTAPTLWETTWELGLLHFCRYTERITLTAVLLLIQQYSMLLSID